MCFSRERDLGSADSRCQVASTIGVPLESAIPLSKARAMVELAFPGAIALGHFEGTVNMAALVGNRYTMRE